MDKVRLLFLYNNERLDPEKFDDDKIIKESRMSYLQFEPRTPNWVMLKVNENSLDDETSVLQYGQSEESVFYDMTMSEPGVSSWNDNLIEKPGGRYKFNSMEVNFS